jgi:acetoin utilization protein AcuB
MRIQDVMSSNVVRVVPETKVAAAREALRVSEIRHLVVTDGKQVVGVVTGPDMQGAADDTPVSEVMSRHVVTIEPNATIRRAAGIMRGRGVGCLPVVDDGRLVGIVTASDFLTGISKGEIHAAPPNERMVLRKRGPRKTPTPVWEPPRRSS